jgi:hypothetical protein
MATRTTVRGGPGGGPGQRKPEWAHLGSNQEQPGYEPGALTD